jgi:hypothetical protein
MTDLEELCALAEDTVLSENRVTLFVFEVYCCWS